MVTALVMLYSADSLCPVHGLIFSSDSADVSLSTAFDICCAIALFIYKRFPPGKCLTTSTPQFVIHSHHVNNIVWLCWGKEGQLG